MKYLITVANNFCNCICRDNHNIFNVTYKIIMKTLKYKTIFKKIINIKNYEMYVFFFLS